MGTRLKGRLSLLLLSFAVVMFIFPAMAFAQDAGDSTSSSSSAPTIQSDKADYAPGETVTLTGSNWQPGESVHINVNDDQGKTWSRDLDVAADANGQIQDQFQLPDWFVALYSVKATGASGSVATTTFTDANLKVSGTFAGSTTSSPDSYTLTYQRFSGVASGTTCGGTLRSGDATAQTQTITTADFTVPPAGQNCVQLTAPATSAGGRAFLDWTDSDGNVVNGTVVTGGGTRIAVDFPPGGTDKSYKANYGIKANNDAYSVNEDNTLNVPAPGVLNNDAGSNNLSVKDSNPAAPGVQPESSPSNGTLTLNANGSFTYTPNGNFNGTDSFTYKATNGTNDSNVATVIITVNAVNDAPVANDQQVSTAEDNSKLITLSATDVDNASTSLSYKITSLPSNGTLYKGNSTADADKIASADFTLANNGNQVTYKPNDNYHGSDSFNFKANDGSLDSSAAATVSITVTPVNDPPVAINDALTTNEDTAGNGNVLTNDTDVDNPGNSNAGLTVKDGNANAGDGISPVSGPSHGQLSLNANGSFTYTPNGQYNGPDSFTYKATDGSAESNPATVSITVREVNDEPVANTDSPDAILEDSNAIAIDVRANDTPGPANESTQTLTLDSIVSAPTKGNAQIITSGDDTGKISYKPNANANGSDSFTYKVCDNGTTAGANDFKCAIGTVNITITPVNDAPVVTFTNPADATQTVDENKTTTRLYTYTVTDVDNANPTVDESCGSGSKQPDEAGDPQNSFRCLFPDGPASTTVTATADDGEATNNTGSDSIDVTVRNVAPTVNFTSGATEVNEGTTHTYSYTVSDPGDDTVQSVSTSCDAANSSNGVKVANSDSFNSTTNTYSFECRFPDGPASATVSAQATDSDNATGAAANKSVSVKNLAPVVTLAGANPLSVQENKNGSETFSFTVSDPGNDPIASVETDCDADSGTDDGVKVVNSDTFNAQNNTGNFKCTFPDGPADALVKVSATDDDGAASLTGSDSKSVTVNNVAPTVSFTSGPANVDEGTKHTYSYEVTDPGNDTFSVVDTYPKCGQYGNVVSGSATTTASGGSFECFFPDGPAETNVAIKVADSDGASDTASEAVQVVAVANVAPSVTAPANQSANEGAPTSFSLGSFTDPGPDSPWSVDVDWGDGSAHTTFTETATGPVTSAKTITAQSHTYADNGQYTVTVKVTDKNGAANNGVGSATFRVDVANAKPVVSPPADDTGLEGTSRSFGLGSFTDAGVNDGPWKLSVDWGDGSGVENLPDRATQGPLGSAPHAYDDNGTYTMSVTVTDKDGGSDTKTSKITINNVAPTGTLSNNGPIDEGGSATVSFTDQFDPSGADTAAGFRYAYRCDGAPFAPAPTYAGAAGSTASTSCSFADNGTYTVRAAIIDKNDGYTVYTTDVVVRNLPPAVTAPANQSSYEGENKLFSLGSFSDSGPDSPWTVDVDWGDGSNTTFTQTATGVITAKSHTYGDNLLNNGPYTVKVKVTDKDGSSDTKSFTINVANVDPTASASNPAFVFDPVLGTATASFDFSDVGFLDTHSASYFTWSGVGDPGNRPATVTAQENVAPDATGHASDTRTLNPGCYNLTVTGTAVDDDGGDSDPVTLYSSNTLTSIHGKAFLPPIMDNERNIARYGNVVPVKVQLTNTCTGGTVTNVTLYITIHKGSGNEVIEDNNPIAESVSSADTGSQMRVVDGRYMYNLSTRNMTANSDWTVRVRLGSTTGPVLLQAVFYPKK